MSLEKLHPAGRQTVAGMLAKGWIAREVDARLGARYCITPAGEAALRAQIPRIGEGQNEGCAALSCPPDVPAGATGATPGVSAGRHAATQGMYGARQPAISRPRNSVPPVGRDARDDDGRDRGHGDVEDQGAEPDIEHIAGAAE